MNELISLIETSIDRNGNRFRFDGKHFHFYSNSDHAIAGLRDAANETKHVYGVNAHIGYLSFRCDKARFRDQLIDLVLSSKGF